MAAELFDKIYGRYYYVVRLKLGGGRPRSSDAPGHGRGLRRLQPTAKARSPSFPSSPMAAGRCLSSGRTKPTPLFCIIPTS